MTDDTFNEMTDEIQALRAEDERLRGALQEIVDRDEIIDFLIFCGLTAAEIADRAVAYLEAVS